MFRFNGYEHVSWPRNAYCDSGYVFLVQAIKLIKFSLCSAANRLYRDEPSRRAVPYTRENEDRRAIRDSWTRSFNDRLST